MFLVVRKALALFLYTTAPQTSIRRELLTTVTVTLKNGTLEGMSDSTYGQDLFLGIPYAQPPVGDLRFRRPQPTAAWNGTRTAQEYGPWCYGVSIGLVGFSQNNTGPMSEDCLTVNIIRPVHTKSNSKLPVAVWIHGGGFSEGSSADQRYNGSFLVQQSVKMGSPIIFVSLNYRLGLFGFLAGPALERAGDTNVAIHDQRLALTWIQENILDFGGDPDHVTIFGESAGATSVGLHLLAYGGRESGLFHAAIAQSGGPLASAAFINATRRSKQYQDLLERANCTAAGDGLECLRSVPADVLNTFNNLVYAHPMIDGTLIEDLSSKLLAKGAFVKVPLLIGSNRNEGSTFLKPFNPMAISTESDFLSLIGAFSPEETIPNATLKRWSDAYQDTIDHSSIGGLGTLLENPGPEYGAFYGKGTLWLGDYLFTAGRRYTNQIWSEHGIPNYGYLFDTVPRYLDPKIYGAAHFADVSFTFDNVEAVGYEKSPFGAPNLQQLKEIYHLTEIMSRMWISFFVYKTPNYHRVPNVVYWPSYSKANATNLVFSATSGVSTAYDTWRRQELRMFIDLVSFFQR